MAKIKVQRDGRLIVPKRIVDAGGLRPGDEIDAEDLRLRRQGVSRRALMRYLGIGAGATALAAGHLANVDGLVSLIGRVKETIQPQVNAKLLAGLFGVGSTASGALVPSGNHPYMPPPAGAAWYPIEESCAAAYMTRFFGEVSLRKVSGFPHIRDDDSVVVFGSQVSNLYTRTLLGNPWAPAPRFHIAGAGWKTTLHWNLHSPACAPPVKRRQYGGVWQTTEHEIAGAGGSAHRVTTRGGEAIDDYLLITALPRSLSASTRDLVFSGIHGVGTFAAQRLFAEPDDTLLERIARAVSHQPYYQALLHVEATKDPTGELRPGALTLVKAKALAVRS